MVQAVRYDIIRKNVNYDSQTDERERERMTPTIVAIEERL